MKLGWRLFRTMGHWPDDAELHEWLRGAGFVPAGGAWFSSQGNLASLQSDEILETATTETTEGVTFVDRRLAPQSRSDPGDPGHSDPR